MKSSLDRIFYKVVYHNIIYMVYFLCEFRWLFCRGLHRFSWRPWFPPDTFPFYILPTISSQWTTLDVKNRKTKKLYWFEMNGTRSPYQNLKHMGRIKQGRHSPNLLYQSNLQNKMMEITTHSLYHKKYSHFNFLLMCTKISRITCILGRKKYLSKKSHT